MDQKTIKRAERIKDKIIQMEEILEELSEVMPQSFMEYGQTKTKAACERIFEKAVEAAVDLAFLIVKAKKLKIPEDDQEAFFILSDKGFIPHSLAVKLKEAKGMRNIIAHEYGIIDDEKVFHAFTEEIERDIKDFISCINKSIIQNGQPA